MPSALLDRTVHVLVWLGRVLVFLLLLGLALRNSEPATLRYYLGLEWRAPLALILFAFFAAGALAGVMAMLGPWARQRAELRRRPPADAAETRGD